MKKMKPILFSTPMVEAILSGRKRQTRRIVKTKPGVCMFCGCTDSYCRTCIERTGEPCYWTNSSHTICSACEELGCTDKAPFQPGDILWVRETWQYSDDLNEPYLYKQKYEEEYRKQFHSAIKWKPSIFMPKDACRIFLKVMDVRVERLNEINEYDSIHEGVELMDTNVYKDYENKHNSLSHARISFATLWDSINGKGSWASNPYVWVYEFMQIEKEGGVMIDFLEQHGFEPLRLFTFGGDVADFYSIENDEVELVVGLEFDTKNIKCVHLVIEEVPPEDDDFGGERINIWVPNCDNKLALYTLLHNFDLLPK